MILGGPSIAHKSKESDDSNVAASQQFLRWFSSTLSSTMNKENLTNYFDHLKKCIEENGLQNHPEHIYNTEKVDSLWIHNRQKSLQWKAKGKSTMAVQVVRATLLLLWDCPRTSGEIVQDGQYASKLTFTWKTQTDTFLALLNDMADNPRDNIGVTRETLCDNPRGKLSKANNLRTLH